MSEQMSLFVDKEIRRLLARNYQRAETILKAHVDILHNMAQALMEWETLDKNQIDELMQGKAIAPPKAAGT